MPTQALRLHKSSKKDIPWVLEEVRHLRQGKKVGSQISSFLNRSEVIIETKQAPDGRAVKVYDIPVLAKMAGSKVGPRIQRGEPSPRRRRKKKAFDPFTLIQDIVSSTLELNTQKYLIAILSKGVTHDA